jgi:hypothetical protein
MPSLSPSGGNQERPIVEPGFVGAAGREWVLSAIETGAEGLGARHLLQHPDDRLDVPLASLWDKFVTEYAMLLFNVLAHARDVELVAAARRAAGHLAAHARSNRLAAHMMRFPQHALGLSVPHILLSAIGDRDQYFGNISERTLRRGVRQENLPFRALEDLWLLHLTGRDGDDKEWRQTLASSSLTKETSPVYCMRGDGYALTHAVFFGTHFGSRSLPDIIDKEAVVQRLEALVVWTSMTNDLDLLGEALLAIALLGMEETPYGVRLGLARLESRWMLSRRTATDLDTLTAKLGETPSEGPRREQYRFQQTYHTIFVLGLLGVHLGSLLQSPCYRPVATMPVALAGGLLRMAAAEQEGGRDAHSATKVARRHMLATPDGQEAAVLAIVLQTRPEDNWLAIIDALNAVPDAQARMSLLLDATMIEACRRYDLLQLGRALLTRCSVCKGDSATSLAAIAFLLDQQLPSGNVGAQFLREPRGRTGREASRRLTVALRSVAEALVDQQDLMGAISGKHAPSKTERESRYGEC